MNMKWDFGTFELTISYNIVEIGGLFTATSTIECAGIKEEDLRMSFPNYEMALEFLMNDISLKGEVAREKRVA